MGMTDAFDSSVADFSGMDGQKDLYISAVHHKTWVKVDEEGTEAAAVTAVGVMALAMSQQPKPFEMIVDHPFFCAITERDSGAILFAGIINNPSAR